MRWAARKLLPDQWPTEYRRWFSTPVNGTVGMRFHPTHAEALARAIRKAYGTPRKATR